MMFDPTQFLNTPIYQLTPAAKFALTGLERNGIPAVQAQLQAHHMGALRHTVPHLTVRGGAVLFTDGPYNLCVIDSILPDDYVRRTFICMDTELEDIRIKMFRASGLIPSNKKE